MSLPLPPIKQKECSEEMIVKRWGANHCVCKIIVNTELFDDRNKYSTFQRQKTAQIREVLDEYLETLLPATIKKIEDDKEDLADLHAKLNNQGVPRPRDIKFKNIRVVSRKDLQDFEQKYFPDCCEHKNSIKSEKTQSTKERNKMLLVILAMAMDKYGYDPVKARNTSTSSIKASLDKIDLEVGTDTIRKYLTQGIDYYKTFKKLPK